MADFLTEQQAGELVKQYMAREKPARSTQALLRASSVTPWLGNFIVQAGKVSDSIRGGRGSFKVEEAVWKTDFAPYLSGLNYTFSAPFTVEEKGKLIQKVRVDYENPPLQTQDGIDLRIMVRTPRISTHDINRGEIPLKDQIVAVNHHMMLGLTQEVLGTSQFTIPGLAPTSVVITAENLKSFPIEMVVRAYMAETDTDTSLYQAWLKGKTTFCDYAIDPRWIPNGKLPFMMDTPSTKSDEHDESVSPEYFFERGLLTKAQYAHIRNAALAAFGMVSGFLRPRGVILADTKTEHGINSKGEIVVQDEVFTMDSSRYWRKEDYDNQLARLARQEIDRLKPDVYSKQFARNLSKGAEKYTNEECALIAARYIVGIQHLTGQRFEPDMRPREERVVSGLQTIVEQLVA
ncbi:MAG: phosphoribosylaminoimidazolesuccinocarboxamide synthase [Candidatus Woesearchaeota archaeon]|nr:phosphoribosylaminoimidazolesuccinocarboxamide synthase [Candidatus Woesearchaeota archaeon]